jgi:gamma-glutamyltranspeptidase/glutathione hydrolase
MTRIGEGRLSHRNVFAALSIFLCIPAAGQRKQWQPAARYAVRGTHGAIAGGSEFATQAGMRLYYQGGNAVDAGIATIFAASVAEFSHFGFGGEAPILIRTAQGKVWAIAGVGTMPKLASAQFFRNRPLQPFEVTEMDPGGLKGIIPAAGIMPALVPGMVDAGLLALREFGTKSFAEVIQPAIDLADGFPLDEMRAASIAESSRFLQNWPDSKRVFMPEGRLRVPGQVFRQTDLARTLRAMADVEKKASGKGRDAAIDAVRDYFYRGDIARRIGEFMKANGGLLRYEDLAAFRLELEEPVSTTYHGYTVYKPGFWSQGPAMIEALNLLAGLDLRTGGGTAPDTIHRMVEALKLAYADRDTYYGDPKFVAIPADILLSKEYAAERRKLIGDQASLEFRPGLIEGLHGRHPSEVDAAHIQFDHSLMASDTTCVDAIDKDGLMFSATPSGSWLPAVIAGDTGIALTERAQSFLLVPGHPNELAGGKRPRVTLSPTLVTYADGRPYAALSTPGGDNQEQCLLQLLLDVIDFGMGTEAAIEAPRFQTRHLVSSFDNHAWTLGDLQLDDRYAGSTVKDLTGLGHRVQVVSRWSSGSAPVLIRMLPQSVIEAAADPYGYRVAHAW